MASFAADLLDELLTVLRTDLGTYDLSTVNGTTLVNIAEGGRLTFDPPEVLIAFPTWTSSYRAALNEYEIRGKFEWFAFAPATGLDLRAKGRAAMDLADEVAAAIQSAHHNSAYPLCYSCTELLPSVVNVFADESDVPDGIPQAQGELTFVALRSRGG